MNDANPLELSKLEMEFHSIGIDYVNKKITAEEYRQRIKEVNAKIVACKKASEK